MSMGLLGGMLIVMGLAVVLWAAEAWCERSERRTREQAREAAQARADALRRADAKDRRS